MRLLARLAIGLLFAAPAFSQGARVGDGHIVFTTKKVGALNVLVTVPNANIEFCAYPNIGVPCVNLVTTYTDATLSTSCPTTAQVTISGTDVCVANGDAQGNWGVWVPPGNYSFTINSSAGIFGPYYVTAGGTGGGGGSTSPGSPINSLQYNNAGAFGGTAFTFLNNSGTSLISNYPSLSLTTPTVPAEIKLASSDTTSYVDLTATSAGAHLSVSTTAGIISGGYPVISGNQLAPDGDVATGVMGSGGTGGILSGAPAGAAGVFGLGTDIPGGSYGPKIMGVQGGIGFYYPADTVDIAAQFSAITYGKVASGPSVNHYYGMLFDDLGATRNLGTPIPSIIEQAVIKIPAQTLTLAAGAKYAIKVDAGAGESQFDSALRLNVGLKDNTGSLGTSGWFLSTDGTKTAWAPVSGGGGGVSSFNTRVGAVTSATNDYSFSQISGTLGHAQLPTLLSGDIPNNAANTSGSAATAATATALVGTPTTCSAGLATIGVDSGGNAQGCFTPSSAPTGTAAGDLSGTYPNPAIAKIQGNPVTITSPASGQIIATPDGINFVNSYSGVTVNRQSGTTYTIDCPTDRFARLTFSNTSAVAVTLPQAGSTACFGNGFGFMAQNLNIGIVTITPTTSQINQSTSISLGLGDVAFVYTDATTGTGNYWVSGMHGGVSEPIIADSGAANAYVLAYPSPGGAVLGKGTFVLFTTANPNTTASTINVNAGGTKNITKNGTTALTSGDILAGAIYVLRYDGTEYQLMNPSNSAGGGGGSVTTFSAGTLSPLFTTSVATATTTPALTFSLSTAAAHKAFMNNTGSTAAPGFQSIGLADIPLIPLTSGVSGILPVANGGTGASTLVLPGTSTATANQWFKSYDASTGLFTKTQPAFSDLSGSLPCADMPALTGDTTSTAGTCGTATTKVAGNFIISRATIGVGNCASGVPSTWWNTSLVTVCRTGTNVVEAIMPFADGNTAQIPSAIDLPPDWTGAIDVKAVFSHSAVTGTVIWNVQTACAASNGTVTDDIAFNAVDALGTITLGGTSNAQWAATKTGVNVTGCAAGSTLMLKISRATDTAVGVANLKNIEVTIRRTNAL